MDIKRATVLSVILGMLLVAALACGSTPAIQPTALVTPNATEAPQPVQPTSDTSQVTSPPSATPPLEPETGKIPFDGGPCLTTLAAQLPIEFEFKGTIPTGFDGVNRATCIFTKAVETVTVKLTGPATHTEIFTLAEPTTQVSFPLSEGTLSISTLEIVPPGEYQREMTVTSVDGETLAISDQPGVLKTVTILEPPN